MRKKKLAPAGQRKKGRERGTGNQEKFIPRNSWFGKRKVR